MLTTAYNEFKLTPGCQALFLEYEFLSRRIYSIVSISKSTKDKQTVVTFVSIINIRSRVASLVKERKGEYIIQHLLQPAYASFEKTSLSHRG